MALVLPFNGKTPHLDPTAWAAENATLIGELTVGPHSTIWFGAVLRADVAPIRIGARTNIQDGSVLHATTDLSTCVLGDEVTVGHRVVLHGCTVGNRVLVGMGSVVLDLAELGDEVLLAAGSLVTPRTKLPAGHLCVGSPAKAVRPLHDRERDMIRAGWQSYLELAEHYAAR